MTAMRIVMDRLMPPLREDPIRVTIPTITGADDCTKAQANVLNAVAAGEMLPSEGTVISNLIDAQRKAFETTDIANQLRELREEITKIKGARL